MTKTNPDVAVIGAGIIGTCIAERLLFEGKQVLLLDKEDPGKGCSMGNAGHFASDIIFPLANLRTLLNVPKFLFMPSGPLRIDWRYLPTLLPWLIRLAYSAIPSKSKPIIDALKQLNSTSIERFQPILSRK